VCNILQLSLHFLNTHLNDLLPIFAFFVDTMMVIPTFLPKILFDPKKFFPRETLFQKNLSGLYISWEKNLNNNNFDDKYKKN